MTEHEISRNNNVYMDQIFIMLLSTLQYPPIHITTTASFLRTFTTLPGYKQYNDVLAGLQGLFVAFI